MGNLNMFKERNPQACLTEGSYAGCHTRWRGLESHLYTRWRNCDYLEAPFLKRPSVCVFQRRPEGLYSDMASGVVGRQLEEGLIVRRDGRGLLRQTTPHLDGRYLRSG